MGAYDKEPLLFNDHSDKNISLLVKSLNEVVIHLILIFSTFIKLYGCKQPLQKNYMSQFFENIRFF